VRPIDPLGPLPMHDQPRRGLRWSHIVVLVLLGCAFVWFLVSRANAPEEGGVREVPGGTGRTRMVPALLMAWAATAVALAADPRDDRQRRETERTLLEYQALDLSSPEAEAFSALLDRGVQDVEALVGPSLPSWARRTGRLRFVVSSRIPIARTRGTTVLLPLERVRTRSAPYLHETVHALVPLRGDRVWLAEGLASYLESWVSENRSGYDAHVFTRAGDRGIHRAAQRYLESEAGRDVLPWVGGHGEPPLMETDRNGVARPFYVLSQSLTKYVVDSAGLGAVVRGIVEGSAGGADELGGRPDAAWKRDWMALVKALPAQAG
jgi:hypothetical protein